MTSNAPLHAATCLGSGLDVEASSRVKAEVEVQPPGQILALRPFTPLTKFGDQYRCDVLSQCAVASIIACVIEVV